MKYRAEEARRKMDRGYSTKKKTVMSGKEEVDEAGGGVDVKMKI